MIRLSGTVSSGATVKVYLHHQDDNSDLEIEQAISYVKEAVQQIMKIQQYLGDNVQITTT